VFGGERYAAACMVNRSASRGEQLFVCALLDQPPAAEDEDPLELTAG
jgi:hypothetical protein